MSDETPAEPVEEPSWRKGESLVDAWHRQVPKQLELLKRIFVEHPTSGFSSVEELNASLAIQSRLPNFFGGAGEDIAGKIGLSASISALVGLLAIDHQRRSAWEAKMESELAEHQKTLVSLALFRQTALALFPDLRALQPRHEVADADEFTWVGNKAEDGKPSL